MIISNHPQSSPEWFAERAGIATASEFDCLVSPTGKVKTGDGPTTYLHKKLAAWWHGTFIETVDSFWMEQGRILESEAIPWYELEYDTQINRVGFITKDNLSCGCSPDGLIGDTEGIEIKCPASHTHMGYLLGGICPQEYIHQVQGSLYITGFKHWKFVSYRRGIRALVVDVEPDKHYQEALHEAIILFNHRLAWGKERLIELNGGPPKRFASKPKPVVTGTELTYLQ